MAQIGSAEYQVVRPLTGYHVHNLTPSKKDAKRGLISLSERR